MCGICGVMSFKGRLSESAQAAVHRMSSQLVHRGPDDAGEWTDGGVAVAQRRLSIIDVEKSRQPMVSADGRKVLVFNGEILNYKELRGKIAYPYVTSGDTETILAAHAEFGDRAVERLQGQFAYCLYDTVDRSMTLVRDRMGILPLYWWSDGEHMAFSSELSSLVRGLDAAPRLSPDALAAYLGARSVPAPDTLIDSVHKIRPGHYVRVSSSGAVEETCYWKPSARRAPVDLSPTAAVNELDRKLTASVERSLTADVPVGAYLSGGIDSSLIVARAAQLSGRELHTYCAGFGDVRTDETSYADLVSRHCGTRHHVVEVQPDDFMEAWPSLSKHRGAPLSEPADIAVYQLAKRAREDVRVVLSGEGSDELFAGYPKHRMAAITRAAGVVPTALRRPVLSKTEGLLPVSGRRLGVALRALSESTMEERLDGWFAPFTGAERDELLGYSAPLVRRSEGGSALRSMMNRDLGQWLPDNLLERGDRMTMAASVELRPPFLDSEIVDFSMGLPNSLLVHRGRGKWLVKKLGERYLPTEIVHRRKSGFKVPLNEWFRGGLRDYAWDLVTSSESVTQTYMNPVVVRELFQRHDRGIRDESIRIWTLASLEVWHRTLAG